MSRTTRTPEKISIFLEALAENPNVTEACRVARIARRSVYEWKEADEEFSRAWEAALRIGIATLEEECMRRARDGTLKPVYQNGKKVGDIREYSDTLAIFLLKAHDSKYRQKQGVELSGEVTLGIAGAVRASREEAERQRRAKVDDDVSGPGE